MCGLAGFFKKESFKINFRNEDIVDTLIHRGPDKQAIYSDERIFLVHTRLKIIDLTDAANQPMHDEINSRVIVFNGEIYNYPELKKELQSKGHSFETHSDTEVILKGFQEWGKELFKMLNGIFSFAIFDNLTEKLFIVRDRLGVKPLYVHDAEKGIFFASEIKTILKFCPELKVADLNSLKTFLYYGNTTGFDTMYRDIKIIPPGSYYEVSQKEVFNYYYWKPEQIVERKSVSLEDASENVKELLEKAVTRQLISDVPIGIFLSGGIDSSAVTAIASRNHSGRIKTFAAAFDFDKGVNELEKARMVAKYFNTEHFEFNIGGTELPYLIEKMIYHHDEPFSDAANIPLYLMSREVKKYVSVVLQGDGGDELFGGYNRYSLIKKYGRGLTRLFCRSVFEATKKLKVPSGINRVIRVVDAFGQKDDAILMALLLTQDTLRNSTFQLLSTRMQSKLEEYDAFSFYRRNEMRFRDKDLLQKMLYTDTQIILPNTFLEKVDKSTMAASVESRVPFLDNDLVDYALSLPSGIKLVNYEKKGLLKKALRGILPDSILDAPKTGFSVPYENWLRQPLYDFFIDRTHSNYIREMELFDYKLLDKRIAAHKNSGSNFGFQLWKILNLCIWLENNRISI